jgi:hypothetical protein
MNAIDWKKICCWALLFFFLAGVWTFLAIKIFSCNGCNKQEEAERSIVLIKDSTDQDKIDSLSNIIDHFNDSISVLNYQITEKESARNELQTKFEIRYKLIEIENSDELYKQNRIWLNPLASPSAELRSLIGKKYEFDSIDNLHLAQKHAEYDYLKKDRELLLANDSLKSSKIKFLEYSISDYQLTISFKDDQIKKLTSTPVPIIKGGHAWYVDAGMILGSFALGFATKTLIK